MSSIKTLYIVNHSHTDIGFTDYQDLSFRQHVDFINKALDLCEATSDYPDEARFRWTCEVTGMTERFFREASEAQIERFIYWHKRGQIDIAGMQYNMTPLLDTEQMIRSLYPIRRMRESYGVSITSAMQSDVNGISWLFADLLPDLGVDFLTMSVNPSRGGVPKPVPNGFWWESPTKQRLLVWNGFHYLFGRNIAKLGDWRFVENDLQVEIQKLENDPDYTFDFMYCQSTNPIRVDNGPPDPRMPDFVRKWNESGKQPRMVLTTPTEFAKILREQYGEALPVQRGDWLDWWSDGVASSAYETGMNRATHELLDVAEMLGSWASADGLMQWPTHRATDTYENATLYDEHTWGGFASVERPESRWVKAQWNRKASYAYSASSEAHDLVARSATALSAHMAEGGFEGTFNLGDLDPNDAYRVPDKPGVLVINPLPWDQDILIDEPELRGGAAPEGVLDCFFPRDVSWGGYRPMLPVRRVKGTIPAHGFAFLDPEDGVEAPDLESTATSIQNEHYKIVVDPLTGGLKEWTERATGHNFAGTWQGYTLGQYVYEWIDSDKQRDALFVGDFSAPDFGHRPQDTPFVREVPNEIVIDAPVIDQGIASISVHIKAKGINQATCVYSLRTNAKSLDIDWLLDKQHETDPESVFIAFPFSLGDPSFRADINGLPLTPEQDQLSGTVRDWYPLSRWVDVSDADHGVTVVPLEAPLVHLGGITTGKWAKKLEPESPTIMSWALNNHWTVNFKASQGGAIPLRYRLTTHTGPCDDAQATMFARKQATPFIAFRDSRPVGPSSGQFLEVGDGPIQLVHMKPADFGEGVILRLQNFGNVAEVATLAFRDRSVGSVMSVTPDERDLEMLEATKSSSQIRVNVDPGQVRSIRVVFSNEDRRPSS